MSFCWSINSALAYFSRTSMRRLVPSVFLLLISIASMAQLPIDFNQLVHRTHAERVFLLNPYYELGIRNFDSLEIAGHINTLRELAEVHNDPDLNFEADVIRAHYLTYSSGIDEQFVVSELNNMLELGEKNKSIWFQVRIHSVFGHYYFDEIGQYEYALVHLTKAANLMDEFSVEVFPFKYLCNAHVGEKLFRLEDFEGALSYFRKSINPKVETTFACPNVNSYNSIGLIFRLQNQLDSADVYFQRALDVNAIIKSPWWEGIASGNLGENHYLRGEFEKAIPLLELDLERAEQSGDLGLASNALVLLGNIAIKQNEIKKATVLLSKARSYAYRSQEWKRLSNLYPSLIKLAGYNRNAQLVALYTDSSIIVNDSLARIRSSLLTTRTQQKLDREKYLDELQTLELERENEVLKRNAVLLLLLLILSVGSFVVYKLWQRFQQKKQALLLAEKRLSEFMHQLADRNKQLEELQTSASSNADNALNELQNLTILTDEDWENFKILFDTVHKGFLTRLEQKFADLNPSDTRFIALSKLNLSAKEMAGVLGVGTGAIRQYRWRLRNRLSLSANDDLEELIAAI